MIGGKEIQSSPKKMKKSRMYMADSVWHQVGMANSFRERGRGADVTVSLHSVFRLVMSVCVFM